jgi:hypothetical protein
VITRPVREGDIVKMNDNNTTGIADGKLGSISIKARDLLAGRDPFPLTCPMTQSNG